MKGEMTQVLRRSLRVTPPPSLERLKQGVAFIYFNYLHLHRLID